VSVTRGETFESFAFGFAGVACVAGGLEHVVGGVCTGDAGDADGEDVVDFGGELCAAGVADVALVAIALQHALPFGAGYAALTPGAHPCCLRSWPRNCLLILVCLLIVR
jgi:hypothetical protein